MSVDSPAVRRSNRPQRPELHPMVYRLLIGSVGALFLSVWIFFSHDAYTTLQLAVVAAFLTMFVGVPWAMARMTPRRSEAPSVSFDEWRSGDFATWTGPLPAGQAAAMILIAPAAIVVGMFAISGIAYMAAVGVL